MSTRAEEVPNQGSNSEDSIQQTNTQDDPVIDPRYVEDLENRIAQQQIQNRRMEILINEIRENQNNRPADSIPRPRDIEADRNRYYNDPIGTLDEQLNERDTKILNQMREMLKPIHEVAASFRTNSEYENLKRRMKIDPLFSKALKDPEIEATVDAIMSNPGIVVSEDSIRSAIAQSYGMKQLGAGVRNRGRVTNDDDNVGGRIDPPHMHPSRARIDRSDDTVRKELTEDDRLAMRYANLKPGNPDDERQYWELMNPAKMELNVHKKKEGK